MNEGLAVELYYYQLGTFHSMLCEICKIYVHTYVRSGNKWFVQSCQRPVRPKSSCIDSAIYLLNEGIEVHYHVIYGKGGGSRAQ